MNGLYFLPFVGRNREGGERGEARPIRKQVFLPVPENRVFRSRDSRNTPPKKETGFLKTFFTGDGSNRTDALIFIVFLSLFFLPGSVFFQQTRPNFFPGGTGNRNFLATSYPPTYLPTCPLPLPPLSSYQTEKKEGGGGEPLLPGLAGGVHQCGPGRRTPSHYFLTRTVAAAASRNT